MSESTSEPGAFLSSSYTELFSLAVKEVALRNNGAFVPREVAQFYGEHSARALEIFLDPGSHLFPDVRVLFERFKTSPMLDALILTQGQMYEESDEKDPHVLTLGFQPLKIEQSGILDMLDPLWEKRLKEVGLASVVGGFDKTTEEFFLPIREAIKSGGYEIIVVLDDKEEILEKFDKLLGDTGVKIRLVYVNRGQKKSEVNDNANSVESVTDLSQVEIPVSRTLVLCDFDGTLSDTKAIKQSFIERLQVLEQTLIEPEPPVSD